MSRSDTFEDETVADRERSKIRASVALRPAVRVRWTDARGPHTQTLDHRCLVGASPQVDLVVADPTVSRLHAELEIRDDGVWVRDLGSRNGTYVDGVRVASACVPEEGLVRLGSTVFGLEAEAEPAAVALWPDEHFGPLIGRSVAMRELFARIARIAAAESTVLIQGETGTGKELIARAIHEASRRAPHPYVVVDCAALPEHLLEAELFGHTRGAYTGAAHARAGVIESADGGTVFLDEIGDLPVAMQPKLLRVVESRMVRRLGETAYRKVDVRFISATHRDLCSMVSGGAFREDLFFRLAVLPIMAPPLRARLEDLPLLVEHFVPAGAREAISPRLMTELRARPWLGNVRELRNFVERAVTLGARSALELMGETRRTLAPPPTPPTGTVTGTVRAPSLVGPDASGAMPPVPLDQPFKDVREQWLDYLEREYIRGLLARHGGSVVAVAQAAGLDRTYVHRLIKKHGLSTG
jgi:two-component system response regulator GlrR